MNPNKVRRPLTGLKRVKKEQKHKKSMLFEYFGTIMDDMTFKIAKKGLKRVK